MSKSKLVVLFLISFLLFAVVLAPLSLIVNQLPLPKGVSYKGLGGTLWQGKVDALETNGVLLEDIQWRFDLSNMLIGNVGFDIKFGNPRNSRQFSGRGIVSTGLSGHLVNDFVFRMPADGVKPFLPIPVGDISGRLITKVDIFEVGQPICEQLSGEFIWTKAGVDINGLVSFGTIASTLLCEDNSLVAKFDGDNSLGIEGSALLKSASQYGFEGYIKPDASLPAIVHDGMSMLGKMDNKGRYKVKL